MGLTRKTPIEIGVRMSPGSVMRCIFKAKALTKDAIKINVNAVVYYKSPTISNATNVVMSTKSVFTSGVYDNYEISVPVPDFTDYVRSLISISIDGGESYRDEVDIKGMQIVEHKLQVIKNEIQVASQQSAKSILTYDVGKKSIITDKIVLLSTWNVKCGIATYTNHLLDHLNSIYESDLFTVFPVNNKIVPCTINGKLLHLQHEYGIIQAPPISDSKVIITWHTIPANISNTIRLYESKLNVVAHIVHSEPSKKYVRTLKDVHVISHGSALIPEMKKEDARKTLNIKIDKPIGFVFGFQSGDKRYDEIIDAAKNTGIHIIISAAAHGAYGNRLSSSISSDGNVTFLNTYLTEDEVNLYASASDILLFDYTKHIQYSVSGAMHRVVGAGRPVICSDIKHFADINIALKFKNQDELECAIVEALENQESLGELSLEYAKDTSWESVAKRHIEIYRKYVDL